MSSNGFPLVIEAPEQGASLHDQFAGRKQEIETTLATHGAILYRGFAPVDAEQMNRVVETVISCTMRNDEESSPRSKIQGAVYTSTHYRSDREIFPHNEYSYSRSFPMKLFFCCARPSEEGGETPLADCRRVLQRIDPRIRVKFREKKWMYVRNFSTGVGVSWQEAFNTSDRQEVEAYCRNEDVTFEWTESDSLRTRQVREPSLFHPLSGAESWFNHATFFNIESYDPDMKESLLEMFGEVGLPHNTYYGDGTRIEPEVIRAMRHAYMEESVPVRWQKGDMVVIDNLLTAHSRKPFKGERSIYLIQADPIDRTKLATDVRGEA